MGYAAFMPFCVTTLSSSARSRHPECSHRGRVVVLFAAVRWDAIGRYCCKSLFALVITIPPGCRRDFRVKMWGTSSPDDKLTGDLGNVIETTQIGGRRSDRLTAGNLSPGNFGLLQHNRHKADIQRWVLFVRFRGKSGHP